MFELIACGIGCVATTSITTLDPHKMSRWDINHIPQQPLPECQLFRVIRIVSIRQLDFIENNCASVYAVRRQFDRSYVMDIHSCCCQTI